MNVRTWVGLAAAVALSEGAGIIGALFTAGGVGSAWYAGLVMPALALPSWVFGPVWFALYALMGIALWLVWREGNTAPAAKRRALWLFALQLALNAFWPALFFGSPELTVYGVNHIGLAFIEIVVLWLAVVVTIVAFTRILRLAAWLLAPYLLWVSFAAYLNWAIWMLN